MSRRDGRKQGGGNREAGGAGRGSGGSGERNQGYALRIMEALSGVDEELLERCGGTEEAGKRKPVWRSAGILAAALCFIVVGAAGWKGYWILRDGAFDQNMYQGASGGQDSAESVNGGPAAAGEGAVPEAAPENREPAGAEELLLGQTGAVPGEDGGTEGGMWEGYGEEAGPEGGASGDVAPEKKEIAATDTDSACLRLNRREYTEEEARALEGLGGHMPETLPEGYVFSGAYSNLDLDRENLTVCWDKGMDSVWLCLEKTDGAVETVDRDRPETYDERLYKIPYGETVPEEYRQSFGNPVFLLEDFDLEAVKSRMTAYEDSGDTRTPRGHFGVLYPDGVLVSFNGRGTAEEIWDMFCSMEE